MNFGISLCTTVALVLAPWLTQDVHGFTSPMRILSSPSSPLVAKHDNNNIFPRVPVAVYDYPTVSDVQDVVDFFETVDDDDVDEEDSEEIRFRNEMPDTDDLTREDLVSDIQDVIEEVLEDNITAEFEDLPVPPFGVSDFESGSVVSMDYERESIGTMEQLTPEEVAVSASLYMNPATEKISKSLKITWEPEVADTLSRLAKVGNPNRPFMVGIVGIPGSGKSTSAEIIAAMLGEDQCIVMPHDGFHIPLAQLAELPNAADAIYRRGAPDTFDAAALETELQRIAHGDDDTVTIPGFDHAMGDPTPNQHTFIRDQHRIILCEGLYLLHDRDGWENIKSFFDWTIYIDADVDACIERLKERNKCIPVSAFMLL